VESCGRQGAVLRFSDLNPWVDPAFPSWALIKTSGGSLPANAIWRPIQATSGSLRFPAKKYRLVDSNHLLFEGAADGHQGLYAWTPSGFKEWGCTNGLSGASSMFSFEQKMNRFVFVKETMSEPQEVFLCDAGKPARQLTSLNAATREKVRHDAREVDWRSADGTVVHGWVLTPSSRQGPYPLVTLVHGGPGYPVTNTFANYFTIWPYPFEVMAARGMAIFLLTIVARRPTDEALLSRRISMANRSTTSLPAWSTWSILGSPTRLDWPLRGRATAHGSGLSRRPGRTYSERHHLRTAIPIYSCSMRKCLVR